MTQTFTKKKTTQGFRGFTLIELLVVIAIIGLLSTIIAAPIQNARKKARDAKKIAEMKAIQLALDQYAEQNAGQYPITLAPLSPIYMPILPSFASSTLTSIASKDKFAFAAYRAHGTGVNAGGVVFAYHLGAHLESYSQALDNDRDCIGANADSNFVVTGASSSCAFYGLSGANIDSTYTSSSSNFVTGMIPAITNTLPNIGTPVDNEDFSGQDNDTSRCNAITDCVFDVTGQQ